jgi:DNA-directed RNA polymerase sigma subunit (sigma70/sigma32)
VTSDGAVPLTPWQQELVTSAIPIIDTVARRLAKYASLVGLDEMLAMGRQGLVQAARSFDAALGVPFATFATYHYSGSLGGWSQLAAGSEATKLRRDR